MSYLDVPRINFGGKFFTDPSTINNDPVHYQPDNTNPSPWQNPNGQHYYQFLNCSIRSAFGPSGAYDDTDPIFGASIETTDNPSPAKIADIDVYQQGVPTIFGLQLKITMDDGTFILGNMDPATLNQLWWKSVLPTRSWNPSDYAKNSFGGDMNACGMFQSVVRFKKDNWNDSTSKVLQDLKSKTIMENDEYLISMRFVVDGYENVPQNEFFQQGRIIGSMGPVYANEPLYNPGHRWLMPRSAEATDPWNFPVFNQIPFKVDKERKKLVIDLANGICRQTAGGIPSDLGELTAVINFLDPPAIPIGQVDYSAFAYENNSHIAELDITQDQIGMLSTSALSLNMSRNDIGIQSIFTEEVSNLNYCVEVRPVRMSGTPNTTHTSKVYVNKLGIPQVGKQMQVEIISVHGDTPGATVPPTNPDNPKYPTNPGNTPQAEGALAAAISPTDENGYATVTLTVVKDPGQRTPQLDGQLYYILVSDPAKPPTSWPQGPPQSEYISVIVFSEYPVQTNPAWEEVQKLMTPYNKLYPKMRDKIDLTNLHTFTLFSKNPPWTHGYNSNRVGPLGIAAGAIPYYMSMDFNDPRYMPLTRDLSPDKLMTIMHFIKNLQDGNSSPNPEIA